MNQALASILLMAAKELEPSLQRIHRLSVPFVSPLFDGLRREIVIAELMNCFQICRKLIARTADRQRVERSHRLGP
jgi:hypothetical protein